MDVSVAAREPARDSMQHHATAQANNLTPPAHSVPVSNCSGLLLVPAPPCMHMPHHNRKRVQAPSPRPRAVGPEARAPAAASPAPPPPMPSLLRDLVALVVAPPLAAKRSLQSPSARRAPANQNVASSVGPVAADVSTPRKRPVSEREEEQAKMDAFVFFTMMR